MRPDQSPSRAAWPFISVLLLGSLALVEVQAQAKPKPKPQISVLTTCAKAYYFRGSAKQKLCDTKTLELQNYKLETIKDGRGPVEFPNKTKVTLLGKSVFQINKYDSAGLAGTLVSGQIRYESLKKGAGTDRIEGNKTKLVHIGTTFLFSVGTPPRSKASRAPKSNALTWKAAELNRLKLKLSDAAKWQKKLAELCTKTCSPGAWKPGEHKGSVSIVKMKLKSDLQCGCLAEPDGDDDSVADRQDSCPKQAGEPSTSPLLNGCPIMVEQVILLPDADGKSVGTVSLQEKETGKVLATLSKAYASAGVTATGEPVLPQVVEPEPAAPTGTTPAQPNTPEPATPEQPTPAQPTTAPTTTAPTTPSAPATGATSPYPGAPGPGTSGGEVGCYWMNPETESWDWRPHYTRKACFESDNCSGGAGAVPPEWEGSPVGCYKWAAGPDAPARGWYELGCPGPNC
jgi:hypothetical protein